LERSEPLDVNSLYHKNLTFKSKYQSKIKTSSWTAPLIGGQRIDIYAPRSPKYDIHIEPGSFTVENGSPVNVSLSVQLRMTTKCKICLIVVFEQQKIYSAIEFKIASKMSTWIDFEEVEMTDDYLGGGGYAMFLDLFID
jgi:hypothetical protein